jgi:protein TonB
MSASVFPHPGEPRHLLQGWLGSLLFHAAAAATAVALMAGLRLPPETDPFKWNVALVEPPRPAPVAERPPRPTPPKPKMTPVTQPAAPQPVVQAVQQRVVQTVQAVQQVMQREMVQAIQTTSAVTTVNQTASVVTQSVQRNEISQPVAPTAVATATSSARESIVQDTPIVSAQSPTVSSPAPVVSAQAPTVQRAVAPVYAESVQSHPVAEAVIERFAPEQPVQTAVAHAIPTKSVPAAKADYGWLAASIWERIQKDMKNRYPHLARLNRWEGQVLLTVAVKADGSLSDIKIKTSSGHAILDRDAVDFLGSLSPLSLKHPLGKAWQLVEVPISYSLR